MANVLSFERAGFLPGLLYLPIKNILQKMFNIIWWIKKATLYLCNKDKDMTPITKLQKAHEIYLTLVFLGIDRKQFFNLQKEFGGLDGLYNEMARSIGDWDCIFKAEVISCNGSFVTVKTQGEQRKVKVFLAPDGTEFIYALGRYSMAPIFKTI